jgi:protein involved in polysaccharide export with SLBB domain
MIIRSAFGLPSDFSQHLLDNRDTAVTRDRPFHPGRPAVAPYRPRVWMLIAFAIVFVPDFLLAQGTPGSAASTSTLPPAVSAPATSSGVGAPAGYILSPNDQIAVEVFGEDDLRTNGRLNPEGNLSLPLLGSIHLAGLTLTQAASKLTELYGRDYLVSPKVNVMLLSYAKRRFSILGQINRPGSYEMPDSNPGGIDLLEAVAMAGGYTRIAAPERITVRRHTAAGDQIFKVNAKRFTKGSGGGFRVEPGDTITVGESIF